jgi:hypothetical protein
MKFPARSTRALAVATAGAMFLSACAMEPGGPMTAEQQQLHESNNRFASTVAEGAILGAVLGAGLGYLAGGSRGMLTGAGAGLAAGTAAGYLVAQNNYTQSRTEQNYQSAIEDARKQAAAFDRDAALSEQIVAQASARAAQLQTQLRSKAITADQYRQQMASYSSTIKDIDVKHSKVQEQITALNQSAAVTPGPQAAPFSQSVQSIQRADQRMAAAQQRLRQLTVAPSV